MIYYVYSDELTHHGIKGQKWGTRRWQNPDGTLTEAGKRRYGTAENLAAGKTLKTIQKEKDEKERLINSGNAALIKKNTSKLTDEEFQRALNRLDKEKRLSEISAANLETAKKKFDSISNAISDVAMASEKFISIYNSAAKVWNTFNPDKKWKVIGGDGKGAEELTKLYNLQRKKQEDARADKVNAILQEHSGDLEWMKKHAKEYTTEEIRAFNERSKALQNIDKNSSNDDSNQNNSKKKSKSNQQTEVNNNQDNNKVSERNTDNSEKSSKRQEQDPDVAKGWEVFNRLQSDQRIRSQSSVINEASKGRVINAVRSVRDLNSTSNLSKGQAFISSLLRQNGGYITNSDMENAAKYYPQGEQWIKDWLNGTLK